MASGKAESAMDVGDIDTNPRSALCTSVFVLTNVVQDNIIDYAGVSLHVHCSKSNFNLQEWVNNVRHGKCRITFKDGNVYSGDIIRERQTGHGLLVSPDGSQYYGGWMDGKRHGDGAEVSPAGTICASHIRKRIPLVLFADRGSYWRDMRHGPGKQAC